MVHERQRRLGQDGSSKGLSEHVNVAVIELGTLRGIMMGLPRSLPLTLAPLMGSPEPRKPLSRTLKVWN